MSDFTEVTNVSLGQRLKNAVGGVVFGGILVVAGPALLFWNEGRAVERARTLEEGAGMVISLDASAPSSANEGRLVHFSGRAETAETLRDPDFGQSHQALKLMRSVEMYQWQERTETKERKKAGGGTEKTTTYSYEMDWDDDQISSSSFKRPQGHENPSFVIRGQSWQAESVRIGGFLLADSFTRQIGRTSAVTLGQEDLAAVPPPLGGRLQLSGGHFYLGADPSSPQIGDHRISFQIVDAADVTVVGRQTGQGLASFQTKAGGTIELLQYGRLGADQMFAKAKTANTTLTWALRAGGTFALWLGFVMIFSPLAVAADIIPFIGRLVGAGASMVAGALACTIALVTIAIGWIFYRPLLGISLLAAAVLIVVLLVRANRAKAAPPPPPVPPPPIPPPPPPG